MLQAVSNEHVSKFTNTQSLVAAYKVGKNTHDPTLCQWLFPCKNDEITQARIQCSQTAHLCPGYSISCALCGIFLPNTCGLVCPVGEYIVLKFCPQEDACEL